MVNILEIFGGWPVVKGSEWISENWEWMDANRNISMGGLDDTLLFSLVVLTDQRNSSKRVLDVRSLNILMILNTFSYLIQNPSNFHVIARPARFRFTNGIPCQRY